MVKKQSKSGPLSGHWWSDHIHSRTIPENNNENNLKLKLYNNFSLKIKESFRMSLTLTKSLLSFILKQWTLHTESAISGRGFKFCEACYHMDPEFSDRQVRANCRPRSNCSSSSSVVRVYTVCHSGCLFWTHYTVQRTKKPHNRPCKQKFWNSSS